MNRFTLLVMLLVLSCLMPSQVQAADTRPNILFCIADDWGWPHASAYGDPVVKTPVFDRVATEGVLFHHAYISSPSCTPSRNAILTGQQFWRLGSGANLWSEWPGTEPTYPLLLEKAGYQVGHYRKSYGPGKLPANQPHPAGPNFKSLTAFLDKKPADAPFCFWFGASDPHRPYAEGSGKKSGMDLSKIKLFPFFPDHEIVRSDYADYYFEVQRFDTEVGEALAELEKRGLLENTIVVITGDHGMPFPRCKGNLYDSGARVPMAVQWPAKMKGNRVINDFMSTTDLGPTFLEAAGVKVPEAMTGRSLLPLLTSDKQDHIDPARDHIYYGKERHVAAQEGDDYGGTPMRAIRTRDFLYIRNFTPDRWPAGTPNHEKAHIKGVWLGDCDNGPTKSYIVDHQNQDDLHRLSYALCFGKRPLEELYDLKNDPDQLRNVVNDPAHAPVKEKLWKQLKDYLTETKDPRVIGGYEAWETQKYHGSGPRFGNK